MGAWLDRLKTQKGSDTCATKPTKPTQDTHSEGSVGFVAYHQGNLDKFEDAGQQPDTLAANGPATDLNPDRYCWPHSSAWNTCEIELFNRRAALFVRRGADEAQAEKLADRLVTRDREDDDCRLCLECRHLQGATPWRCGNWFMAGVAVRSGDAGLARDMVMLLQRCPGAHSIPL